MTSSIGNLAIDYTNAYSDTYKVESNSFYFSQLQRKYSFRRTVTILFDFDTFSLHKLTTLNKDTNDWFLTSLSLSLIHFLLQSEVQHNSQSCYYCSRLRRSPSTALVDIW